VSDDKYRANVLREAATVLKDLRPYDHLEATTVKVLQLKADALDPPMTRGRKLCEIYVLHTYGSEAVKDVWRQISAQRRGEWETMASQLGVT